MTTILNEQIRLFLKDDMIASLANISAVIKENDHELNWAGFYFVKNDQLVLGPFQGKPACTPIAFDKGVCGRCYTSIKTQKIDDVLKFPGHIACDSDSRSELCVPVLVHGQCIMEIDLDSPFLHHFTDEMVTAYEEAAADIAKAYTECKWVIQ